MIKQSYNSELGNKLGNLHSRLTKFIASRFESRIPPKGSLEEVDVKLRRECLSCAQGFASIFPLEQIPGHVASAITSIERINQYITEEAPWTLVKNSDTLERCQTVIYVALDCLRLVLEALRQVIPRSAAAGLSSLGAESRQLRGDCWKPLLDKLKENGRLVNTDALFPRVE